MNDRLFDEERIKGMNDRLFDEERKKRNER